MNSKSARRLLAIHPPDLPEDRQVTQAHEIVAKSPELLQDYEAQLVLDRGVRSALHGVAVPEPVVGDLAKLAAAATACRSRRRFNPKDPAMLSVLLGFLLLVAVLVWHFLGRAGIFPEEALAIATEGAKLRVDQFEPVTEKAGSLEDWFALKGFDSFRIPAGFDRFEAAGARIFKIENQPVAVLAIPENMMFFLVFDSAPLGVEIRPQGSWQFVEFDLKYAAAIREERGLCFMVVIKGKRQDLQRIIEKSAAK